MMILRNGQINKILCLEKKIGKNPRLASFLSFLIPGLGQLYNGDRKKGILFMIPASLMMAGYEFTSYSSQISGVYFIFWLFSIYEAADRSKRINFEKMKDLFIKKDDDSDIDTGEKSMSGLDWEIKILQQKKKDREKGPRKK